MTPYTILAPGLETHDARLLKVALGHAKLPWPDDGVVSRLTSGHRFVLSVGKAGLESWHEFGLIQVSANHGDVFTHYPANGNTHEIMVVEHPAQMNQQAAFVKYSAREDMLRNLQRFAWLIRGGRASEFTPKVCGGCLAQKRALVIKPAEWWVEELDGVGMCDGHYRQRAKYRKKRNTIAVGDRGKIEHQIPGQLEMLPGDGTKIRVPKSRSV